ncbi:50S ribosomal protein L32 [Candidatus Dependentiae bacterium]|nr:50S ribosomal protein L32 [Candidatus Dependentiae bacterium]MCC7414969.1 50S ribosomal protein L32 [Campylobacterota bacterium]
MPVPKRKRSRRRRDKRFANKHVVVIESAVCPTCKEPRSSHQVCTNCGHYKGVKVMVTKADRMMKRGASRKAQEARKASHGAAPANNSAE